MLVLVLIEILVLTSPHSPSPLQYHGVVLDDKRQELCNVLRCVGAKSITFSEHGDWNRVYASPVTMQPDLLDDRKNGVFKFLRATQSWKDALQLRLDTMCATLTLDFVYDEDLSVNDSVVDTMMEKLEVTPRERDDLLGPALHAKTMLALEQNKVINTLLMPSPYLRNTPFARAPHLDYAVQSSLSRPNLRPT